MVIEEQTKNILMKNFLKEKQTAFNKNIFSELSFEEKISFIRNNGLIKNEMKIFKESNYFKGLSLLLGGMILSVFESILIHPLFLLSPIITFTLAFKIRNKKIPDSSINKVAEKWFESKENQELFKKKMFEKKVVDEETLIAFCNAYSEEELVKILMDNENITYEDMFIYINNEEQTEDEKNKEIRLSKAVRCLKLKEKNRETVLQ